MHEPSSMDDDIDIEEHDVLDNPRIKSIFPDLSCVKIEIPDDDDDVELIENQQYLEENTELDIKYYQPHGSFYQHEYKFGTRPDVSSSPCDGMDPENTQYAETGDENTQDAASDTSDQYYYGNEIILGSKPSIQDHNVLYQEALESHPVVYLENWGQRLDRSPCFCQTCNILFPTVNGLDAHKMISHSYLVALDVQRNTARKSTVSYNTKDSNKPGSKYCNHCNRVFPDDTALIKHLYELLPLNNYDKQTHTPTPQKIPQPKKVIPQPKKVIPQHKKVIPQHKKAIPTPKASDVKISAYNIHKFEDIKFKCLKCNKIFLKYDVAKKHRKVHPGSFNKNYIIRVRPKKPKKIIHVKTEPVVAKAVAVKSEVDEAAAGKPRFGMKGKFFSKKFISKVMFKCNICHVHFLSCFSAVQHALKCRNEEKPYTFKKCTTCKRKIRARDINFHVLQHKHIDKFKIYTVRNNMYDKVLCKCPNCHIYFDELGFWSHYQEYERCSDALSQKCADCNILIYSKRYHAHMQKHKLHKFTPKDFILIEFQDLEAPKKIKVRKDENGRHLLYYCETCGCCTHRLILRCHLEKLCLEPTFNKKVCRLCGLCFTDKSYYAHMERHERQLFNLEKVKFLNLRTEAEMAVPIPDYYACSKCKIHFVTPQKMKKHICGEIAFKKCNICVNNYELEAYKLHMTFHKLKNEVFIPVPEKDIPIPELIKKYKSINNMWNIIYVCASCDLASVSYDSAIEHCQNHINDVSEISEICEKCDFDFLKDSYLSHEKLHESNKKIDRNSFKILTYDYKNLFKETWLDVLKDLPEQHKMLILSKSIYRYRRNIKMNITVPNSTEDSKFYCLKCLKRIPDAFVQTHLLCNANVDFSCRICRVVLPTLERLVHHEKLNHNERKTYQIITFNNKKDKIFNQNLKLYENKCRNVTHAREWNTTKSVSMFNTAAKKKTKVHVDRLKLFKCALCQCCITYKFRIPIHSVCIKGGVERKYCTICDEYFAGNYAGHQRLHDKFPNLDRNSFTFIMFNDKDKNKIEDVKIAGRVDREAGSDVNEAATPTNTQQNKIAYIFQCECGLHYTSKKTITKHMEQECGKDVEISQEVCSKCDLTFPTDVLVTHLCNHHSKETKIVIQELKKVTLIKCSGCTLLFHNKTDFGRHGCDVFYGQKCRKCNLTYGNKSFKHHKCSSNTIFVIDTESGERISTLYKCTLCDICYITKPAFEYHIQQNHKVHTKIVTCSVCGYNFAPKSLSNHMKEHQGKPEYEMNIVDTDSGEVITVTGDNPPSRIRPSRKRRFSDIDSQDSNTNTTCPSDKSTRKRQMMTDYLSESDSSDESMSNTDYNFDTTNTSGLNDTVKSESICLENQTLSKGIRARILLDSYSHELYKCMGCNLHFLNYSAIYSHKFLRAHIDRPEIFKCDICGLDFSKNTVLRHKYIHHEMKNLQLNDFEIIETPVNEPPSSIKKMSKVKKSDDHSQNEADGTLELDDSERVEEDTLKLNFDDSECMSVDVPSIKTEFNDDVPDHVSELSESELLDESDQAGDFGPKGRKLTSTLQPHNYSDKLYKCNECNLHFLNFHTLWCHVTHRKHGESLPRSQGCKCSYCGLYFTNLSLIRHKYVHHEKMKLKLENFNIQEVNASEILSDKPSLLYNNKKIGTEKKLKNIVLYKCIDCGTHLLSLNTLRKHIVRKNPKVLPKLSKCKFCGLSFMKRGLYRHTYLHHQQQSLNLHDFTIVNSDQIAKNMSDSLTEPCGTIKESEDDDEVDCDQVSEFTESIANNTLEEFDTKSENASNSKAPRKLISNLQLSNYSRHLYKCSLCKLHFLNSDTLDSHISNRNHGQIEEFECDVCGLHFTKTSLIRHKYIHHELMKLNLKDLIVKKPLTPKVLTMTNKNKLPRVVEKTVDLQRDMHKILFKCLDCSLHFTTKVSMRVHLIRHKRMPPVRFKCKYCGLSFSKKPLIKHKMLHHEKLRLKRQDFIIIDSIAFKKLSLAQSTTITLPTISYSVEDIDSMSNPEATDMKNKIYTGTLEASNGLKKFIDNYSNRLYHCIKCNLYFLSYNAYYTHTHRNHGTSKEYFECNICGLRFLRRSLERHEYVHHQVMKLNLEDFVIESEATGPPVEHNDRRQSGRVTRSDDIKTDNIVPTKGDNVLFKCMDCSSHFLNRTSLRSHMSRNDHRKMPERHECDICGLYFTELSLIKHRNIHHVLKKFKLEDLVIVTLETSSTERERESAVEVKTEVVIKTAVKQEIEDPYLETDPLDRNYNVLYKCRDCNLHYLNIKSLKYHIAHFNHTDTPEYYKCDICSLDFSQKSIKRHKVNHHEKLKLNLEDFVIEQLELPEAFDPLNSIELRNSDQDISPDVDSKLTEDKAETVDKRESDGTINLDKAVSVDNRDLEIDNLDDAVSSVEGEDLDEGMELDSQSETHIEQNLNVKKIVYHKCSHCNVYFLTKHECLEHCTDHKILDPMMYINCKICDFQFLIESLKDHVVLHHATEFQLENVIVNEYTSLENSPPKTETYYAIDKVQSGLISTTTDTVV